MTEDGKEATAGGGNPDAASGQPSETPSRAVGERGPMIQIRNLHKRFGDNKLLKGVSLDVQRGQVTVFIGPSGSGKTTLLRCINFLEEYDEGEVLIDGQLMGYRDEGGRRVRDSENNISRMRAQMGMVFQNFHLWPHKTVIENVIEGLVIVQRMDKKAAAERGRRLLERVGLRDKIDVYPSTLSGGQMQRAAIARALAMEPLILLFDEPTSSLDPELVGEVLDVMKALAEEDSRRQGSTMVVVTHEIGFAREVADHVIMLDEGHIIEQGPPDTVLRNPSHLRTQNFISKVLH